MYVAGRVEAAGESYKSPVLGAGTTGLYERERVRQTKPCTAVLFRYECVAKNRLFQRFPQGGGTGGKTARGWGAFADVVTAKGTFTIISNGD